ERCGIQEISSPNFVVKLKKCPVSVDVFNEQELPNEYKKSKEVISIDKMKIKEEIQAGVVIPGAQLKQNTRLEIR
ncbi:MAG TPA: siphovirus Gp157 family protein, partial [Aquella sp.]|nr:siphovirus Gp157 family protein [Aquella sp.]